jgi:ADP-L-glycero-D-manno-heptose 6-epimerase
MESDGRYMMENNYRYSLAMLDWCLDQEVPCSTHRVRRPMAAAAFSRGAAARGAAERLRLLEVPLRPDRPPAAAVNGSFNSQVVGFRYFNVYGPRESHKGRMASVAFHHYHQFRSDGKVRLFEGCDGMRTVSSGAISFTSTT